MPYFKTKLRLSDFDSPRETTPMGPYPGYDVNDTYRPDSPVARVKPEGEAFASRNKGTFKNWDVLRSEQFDSPRPDPRCPTDDSKTNYRHGKFGTVKPLLDGSATPRPETAPPRIKQEGEVIAEVSRGGRMCKLLTKYGEFGASPRVPRVKAEAEATAEVHKGGRMERLIHKYGKVPVSARAVPRVKAEAEGIAEVSKGKRMNGLIHSYGKLARSPRAVPRVKVEGEDNAELDKGKRMEGLLHKYGRQPLSAREVPRVKKEGEPNATLDRGGRMDRLIHSLSSLPKSPRSPPRVKNVEGCNNSFRGRGSMGKIFREIGKKTCIYVPGVKKSSYLKTKMM